MIVGCSDSDDVISKISDEYSVHGVGQTTCTQINEQLHIDGFRLGIEVWLQGYFTSVNTSGAPRGFEIDTAGLEQSIEYIKTKCGDPDNADLWVAQLTNIFWRQQFLQFKEG